MRPARGAIFSMEMGAAQLAVRIVGSIGRVNQGNLAHRQAATRNGRA